MAGGHDARSRRRCPRRGAISAAMSASSRNCIASNVKAGETFGAAYIVGWFDDIAAMEKVYDRYKGKRTIVVEKGKFRLE